MHQLPHHDSRVKHQPGVSPVESSRAVRRGPVGAAWIIQKYGARGIRTRSEQVDQVRLEMKKNDRFSGLSNVGAAILVSDGEHGGCSDSAPDAPPAAQNGFEIHNTVDLGGHIATISAAGPCMTRW
jgi:hypothetical protein